MIRTWIRKARELRGLRGGGLTVHCQGKDAVVTSPHTHVLLHLLPLDGKNNASDILLFQLYEVVK